MNLNMEEAAENSQSSNTVPVTTAKSDATHSNKNEEMSCNRSKEIPCYKRKPAQDNKRETTHCNKYVMYFSKLMVGHPKTTLVLLVAFHLLFILITVILLLTGYDLFPVTFSEFPMDLENDQTYLRIKAWENRGNDGSILPKSIVTAERTEKIDTLELFYEAENMLTAENLRHIENLETELIQVSGYEDYCQRDKRTNQCKKPSSILRFFDGSYGPHFTDSSYSRISMIMTMAMSSARMTEGLKAFLGKDTVINSTHAFSSTIRSFIYFGTPLAGYTKAGDRKEDQENKLEQFLKINYRDRLHGYHKNGVSGIRFLFFSKYLIANDIAVQFRFDMLLVIGSFAFLLLMMAFHTKSLFVTGVGVLSILTSFIASVLIYRLIYCYKYFGIYHILSLFMILGIGADDIFTNLNNWRATSRAQFSSLEQRIATCFTRASSSLMARSLTAAVAFVVNALSPFLVVSSFGIFCTTLVLVNFLTSVTLLPTVIMVYHLCWEHWDWPCCIPCTRRREAHVSPSKGPDTHLKPTSNYVVRFFVGPYFNVVTHKIVRWVIVLVSVVLICVFSYYASLLKPSKGSFEYFKVGNNYVKAGVRRMHGYKPSAADQVIKVFLVWGLKPQDRSSCHISGYNCPGRTVWDDKFDLNSKPAQIYLKELCDNILRMNDTMKIKLHARKNSITGQTEIQCFLTNMEAYLQNEGRRSVYNGTADFRLPLTDTIITKLMEAHPEHYNMSAISPNAFHRFIETGVSFWLYDDYSQMKSSDFDDYNEYLGFSTDRFDTRSVLSNTGYYYGTKLKYAAIVVNTNLLIDNVAYEDGLPVMEAWEQFTKEEVAKLPISLSGGFQCTPERGSPWHYFKLQKALVESTTRLLVLAIILSFIAITLTTWNVILGCLAMIMIGINVIMVIGFISLMGWQLGTIEAVNLSYVIGLTVVYIVPLAKGYQTSSQPDRTGRVKDMLERVGITTLSSGSLAIGSLFFLCFADISIFLQFGAIIVCTVGFALFHSFGLFTVLLGILGPQNRFGSIKYMYRWCLKRYKRQK